MAKNRRERRRPGYKLIFTPILRLRNGRVLHASHYGKRAFPIWVKVDKRVA